MFCFMGLSLAFSLSRKDYNSSSFKGTATLLNATGLYFKVEIMFTDGNDCRASF